MIDLPFARQGESFETLVLQKRQDILLQKLRWKDKLQGVVDPEFLSLFAQGTLVKEEGGSGGVYFLYDEEGQPRFVIKPVDEDLLCLHNQSKASCLDHPCIRTRFAIPPYVSAQTESLAYALASLLGFEHLTPTTFLAVLSHPAFFDCNDILPTPIGETTREKLCVVRSFYPDLINLHDLAQSWLTQGLTDEDILPLIDQESFEDLYLFIWLIYDTDAHAGNLFARCDEKGHYQLYKLDNALSFPNQNRGLSNALFFLPNARLIPSERVRKKLGALSPHEVEKLFVFYEREDALAPFWERVNQLEELLSAGIYSFRQIDLLLKK